MALNVGEGILNAMSAAGDSPAKDSDFWGNSDGSKGERGYGFKGVYISKYENPDGTTDQTAGPLPVAS